MTKAASIRLRAIATASLAAIVVMGLGGLMTDPGPWYQSLAKPEWQPPGWLFGPAWTILFALIVVAASLVWAKTPEPRARRQLVVLFTLNGVLNVLWSFLFFQMQRPDWALAEVLVLWGSILLLIAFAVPRSRTAGLLLVPYLLWVSFATLLNFETVRMNGPF